MVRQVGVEVVWVRQVLEGRVQKLVPRVADDVTEALVDAQPTAIWCDMRDADSRLLESCAEAGLAFLQRGLCQL